MVVFTCGHCGESVNKPKVEKHYLTKCRGRAPNLSCMDCFKDFFGQDYEGHTKCISEEQRYSAKGFVAKAKKGEEKQNTWVSIVQTVLDEQKHAPKTVIRIVEEICKHTNTPRKKPKFINFVKNVCGHRTMPNDIEAAWDLISVKLNDLKSANQNANQNGTKENGCAKFEVEEPKQTNGVAETDGPSIENGDEVQATTNSENGEDIVKEPLSKKQRKEEKKRRKYEAELQSASVQPPEEDVKISKKNKKKSKHENIEITEEHKSDENDKNTEECNVKAVTENEPKKNKKNKNRKQSEQNGEAEGDMKTVTENEPKQNKKNKNRKHSEQNGEAEGDMKTVTENEPKQNKKNKKRKHSEQNGEAAINAAEPEEDTDELKTKKKKMNESLDDEKDNLHELNVASEESKERTEKFDWHGTIVSLLQKKGNEMPFKRLQKKILAEYAETTGKAADGRIAEKLCKKLKSAANIKVDKNRVLLVE